MSRADLYWLPLGAGGSVVKGNGRIYEHVLAGLSRRRALDIYHAALEIRLPEGRFTVELTPVPDNFGAGRGVVGEGAVGMKALGHVCLFRYELRRWQGGVIPDIGEAVSSPIQLTREEGPARQLFNLVPEVPMLVWGRDELDLGEMWNSNSVIAWLIAQANLMKTGIRAPENGRAPGWDAGLKLADNRSRVEDQ